MIELGLLFVVGYLVITLEHPLKIEKAATALVTGGLCWVVLSLTGQVPDLDHRLEGHLVEIASIVFFLLAAMTIVEVIEAFDGFAPIRQGLTLRSKRGLLFLVGLLTFVFSAVLDNLATTLVMLAVTGKKVPEGKDRWLFAGLIVVAANAGGAFSPIGDVTTTMLWIGGQITFPTVVTNLLGPSILTFLVSFGLIAVQMKGRFEAEAPRSKDSEVPGRWSILLVGVGFLVAVPVLKTILHLPPYLTLLTALGILWLITEILGQGNRHYLDERPNLPSALKRIDLPSILFFVGILLAVGALGEIGLLSALAGFLSTQIANPQAMTVVLGLLSSVLDNVPLVAAAARMFPLDQFPTDAPFWHWLAFASGTGGSLLVIGSAAGVAAMGVAKIPFGWYARRIGLPALAGFGAGLLLLTVQAAPF